VGFALRNDAWHCNEPSGFGTPLGNGTALAPRREKCLCSHLCSGNKEVSQSWSTILTERRWYRNLIDCVCSQPPFRADAFTEVMIKPFFEQRPRDLFLRLLSLNLDTNCSKVRVRHGREQPLGRNISEAERRCWRACRLWRVISITFPLSSACSEKIEQPFVITDMQIAWCSRYRSERRLHWLPYETSSVRQLGLPKPSRH
jgi:hypothetical protein